MTDLLEKIINFQYKYDSDFNILPVDDHSTLIFNYGSYELKFIFSNEDIRRQCISYLNELYDLTIIFDYFIEQEDGLTYYKLKG